jgi:nucleoid DNA-binding protein
MALNKRAMVRHLARATGLTQTQARAALDALLDLWFDELARGGGIAVDNFLILQTVRVQRAASGQLRTPAGALVPAPAAHTRVTVRLSRRLREALRLRQGE